MTQQPNKDRTTTPPKGNDVSRIVIPRLLDFGDYATIEQKNYGVENDHYTHKVIGRLRSNTWVDVPVQCPATETHHDHMEDVISCICCGVSETTVLKYKATDVKPNKV